MGRWLTLLLPSLLSLLSLPLTVPACLHCWHALQVALDALAAGMLVTLLLDAWRITIGGIVDSPAAAAGLQWATNS